MAGLSDILGRNGILEQLLLWGAINQVVQALSAPGLTALQQDVSAKHPVTALDPTTAAAAHARTLMDETDARDQALKSGLKPELFAIVQELQKVRLQPADLATAVLRSYLPEADAAGQAKPQGYTSEMFKVLTDLAGDAPGPDQLAAALRRKLIPRDGRGAASVSFAQGIAESRLHDKWAKVIDELSQAILPPADAASAVVRNFMTDEEGRDVAAKSGVDAATFEILRHLAGDAPGPQQLAEALRRGAIPAEGTGADSISFVQGIAEGRLADKWAPVIKDLAKLWPTPVDAIDALVKGQIPADQGQHLYALLGGDLQFYDWLLHSSGEGPSPLEAATAAMRGQLPWDGVGPDKTSYAQAVHESRFRDKWQNFYRDLAQYYPTVSEASIFLAHGAISRDQAVKYMHDRGASDEVVAAYLNEADLTAYSDYRGLTQSAVTDMYYARLIDKPQAIKILATLHVTESAAEYLLQYADMRQLIDSIQRSVQRIATLYTARKIAASTAVDALAKLNIPSDQVQAILATWELQAAANVKTLTEAQIVDAFYYQIMTPDEANQELQAIGYTEYDAWVVLSNKVKGPLPGKPPKRAAAPPGAVIPGVT